MIESHAKFLSFGEKILIFSGLLFLVSTIYLASGGNFLIQILAKTIYGLGALIFIFQKL
jgi:hypothetical protein